MSNGNKIISAERFVFENKPVKGQPLVCRNKQGRIEVSKDIIGGAGSPVGPTVITAVAGPSAGEILVTTTQPDTLVYFGKYIGTSPDRTEPPLIQTVATAGQITFTGDTGTLYAVFAFAPARGMSELYYILTA